MFGINNTVGSASSSTGAAVFGNTNNINATNAITIRNGNTATGAWRHRATAGGSGSIVIGSSAADNGNANAVTLGSGASIAGGFNSGPPTSKARRASEFPCHIGSTPTFRSPLWAAMAMAAAYKTPAMSGSKANFSGIGRR